MDFSAGGGAVIIFFVTFFFVVTMVAFLRTVFSDPGILPRRGDARNTYDHITQQRRDKPPPRYNIWIYPSQGKSFDVKIFW